MPYIDCLITVTDSFHFMTMSEECTLIACSKLRTFRLTWFPIIPASILGSIISMADMASNKPNLPKELSLDYNCQ